ncbi:MAG: hypothetical protein ACHQPI_09465 [Thermoanaerobaculia bacterium]
MAARPDPVPLPALHERAEENLRFIRETMTRGVSFTAVPGKGGVAMGAIGLAAAALASRQASPREWLFVWLLGALAAFAVGVVAILRKARVAGVSVTRGAGRRFALALFPPFLAGGALTLALARAGAWGILPGLWLLLYGSAVLAAGAHSPPPVPALGAFLVGLGILALALPAAFGNALLAAGFGVGQVVAGAVIARRHGG